MQRSRTMTALAAVFLALAIGSDALGAVLNWEGTAEVRMYRDDPNPTVSFPGGGVATVNGSAGWGGHLDGIRLAARRGFIGPTTTTHIVTDPEKAGGGVAAYIFEAVQGLTGHVPGSFPGEYLPGPIAVDGVVKVCLLSTACTQYLPIGLIETVTFGGDATGLVGLGVGGILTGGGYGEIRISIQAAPWTIKTATITQAVPTTSGGMALSIVSAHGWAHGPQSSTSSTAQPSGMLQLVTPAQVSTNIPIPLPIGMVADFGGLPILTIRFIPEPGLLLLLGSGVGGLVVLERVRRKS